MSIKSIVVHLADDPRHLPRLKLAIDLAYRFDAHLNIVYAKPRVDFPAGAIGRAVSLAYLEEAEEGEQQHLSAVRLETNELCKDLRSWEWHEERGQVDKLVARWAHLADLVVAEQAPREHVEDNVIPHMSDHLVMSAGSPMLLVPYQWVGGSVGTRVLIAWRNGREAIGAVRGALAFLQQAEQVYILAYAKEKEVTEPGADLVAYLGHHGVAAEVCGTSEKGAADILQKVQDYKCNLVVMGAYAHSRLRELILGGSTDYIMRHTTVPVLMRH